MPCCCVLTCSNRSEKGFRLFHLPKGRGNEERRKLWVQNIGRRSLPNNPFVCEIHFSEDQFEKNRADGKVPLKWTAIPTLFTNRRLPLDVAERISKGLDVGDETNEVKEDPEQTAEADVSKKNDVKKKPKRPRKLHKEKGPPVPILPRPPQCIATPLKVEVETMKETEILPAKVTRKRVPMKRKLKDTSDEENIDTFDDVEKTELQRKLKIAENKIAELETNLVLYQNVLEHVFHNDQIMYLMSEPVRGFKWSDETINNALILYESCGRTGYEELRKQNFPFPCAHTLEAVLSKFQS